MKRVGWLVAGLLLGLLTPAHAETLHPVYQSIPDSALAVGVAYRMAETGNKLADVGSKLQLAAANPVAIAKVMLGIGEGLDERGVLAVVVLPPKREGGDPMGALYVQVTDYDELLKPLKPRDFGQQVSKVVIAGREMLVTHKDDFAVFARLEDEEALKKVQSAGDGVAAIVEPMSGWLARQDIAVLALPKSIALGTSLVEQSLTEASKDLAAGGEEMKPALAAFGMYQEMLKTIASELTHGGIGVKLDADGDVLISLDAALKPDGQYARSQAAVHWPKRLGLGQIPAGEYAVAGAMAYPHPWMAEIMRYNYRTMAAGGIQLTEKQAEELTKTTVESMAPIQSVALVSRPPAAGEGFLDRTSAVMICDDAARYLSRYPALLERMNRISAEAKSPALPKATVKPIKIDDRDGYEVSMDTSELVKKIEQQSPLVGIVQKKLFGEDGMLTMYLAAADRETIVMTYGSKDTLKSLLESKQGLGSDEGVTQVAKLLPDEPAGVMYLSATGIIEFVNAVLPMFNPDIRKLPEFPAASPIGLALKCSAHDVEGRAAVKSDLLEKIGDFVVKVRAGQ